MCQAEREEVARLEAKLESNGEEHREALAKMQQTQRESLRKQNEAEAALKAENETEKEQVRAVMQGQLEDKERESAVKVGALNAKIKDLSERLRRSESECNVCALRCVLSPRSAHG